MSLFLAAADPKVGAHHTDIATRTNMNQTKLISKFGSLLFVFVLFFLGEPLVYFPSQVVACYVVSILRQLTNPLPSLRGSIHHWKTPGVATPVPIFLGWFMSFWCFSSQLSQTLTAKKTFVFLGVSLTALPPNTCIFALSLLTLPDVTFSAAARRTALRMLQHLAEARGSTRWCEGNTGGS